MPIFAIPNGNGVVAQMVEQWTENPCVGSSILPDTTPKAAAELSAAAFSLWNFLDILFCDISWLKYACEGD